MNAGRAFVQEVAQVCRRISGVGNGQEHCCSLLYRKADGNDISGLRSAAQPGPHVTENAGFDECPKEISNVRSKCSLTKCLRHTYHSVSKTLLEVPRCFLSGT